MNKEIHSVDKFEKECCDILNQDIETLVSTMMGVSSIKEIEDQKRESAEHSINAKISYEYYREKALENMRISGMYKTLYEKYQKIAHLSSMLLELIEATSLLTNNPITYYMLLSFYIREINEEKNFIEKYKMRNINI